MLSNHWRRATDTSPPPPSPNRMMTTTFVVLVERKKKEKDRQPATTLSHVYSMVSFRFTCFPPIKILKCPPPPASMMQRGSLCYEDSVLSLVGPTLCRWRYKQGPYLSYIFHPQVSKFPQLILLNIYLGLIILYSSLSRPTRLDLHQNRLVTSVLIKIKQTGCQFGFHGNQMM